MSGSAALRGVALCGFLAAALGACRSVAVVPDDASWTITGADEHAEATWVSGPVRVTVPLVLPGDATLLTGSVRNAGPAAVFVTFAPSAEVDRRGLGGTLSGERPDAGGRWTATLIPWREVEVPAGTRGAPGRVDFALSPDQPWTAKEVPPIGATITWVVSVADESGGTDCPLYFHVSAATPSWVDDERTAAAVTLVGLAGLVIWASYY